MKVYEEVWQYDFAKHRNSGIAKATSDYIVAIEQNVLFGEESISKMRSYIDTKEKGVLNIAWENIFENGTSVRFDKLTFFPNDDKIIFENPIHESLVPAVKWSGYYLCR